MEDTAIRQLIRWTDIHASGFPWELQYVASEGFDVLAFEIAPPFALAVGPFRSTYRLASRGTIDGDQSETRLGFFDDPAADIVRRAVEAVLGEARKRSAAGQLVHAVAVTQVALGAASALKDSNRWAETGRVLIGVGYAAFKVQDFRTALTVFEFAAESVFPSADHQKEAANAMYWRARALEHLTSKAAAADAYRRFLRSTGVKQLRQKHADALRRLGALAKST